ncbi:hypothetical protein H0H81_011335 [Sphagnurus paluster]|uniref:Uncharacterized protein n=1 Tax=Sphagnurus paluster TaxID=117069 RepID=A0A9P7K3Y7_9AGAR|nr:hypothetical protein H0H81_011335 [Sphagnurus paluster]
MQAKKRSFSPTSDDGDLVIPPIANDDTPPPPERPLLRQPVAFAWSSSTFAAPDPTALNTYQASVATAPAYGDTYFLPGQEVTLPVPQPRKRKKVTEGPSKKRKPNEYASQTNRFRLQPPSVNVETIVQQSNVMVGSAPKVSASLPVSNSASLYDSSGFPAQNRGHSGFINAPQATTSKTKQPSTKQPSNYSTSMVTKWKATGVTAQQESHRSASSIGKRPSTPHKRYPSSSNNASSSADASHVVPQSFNHYRRDYERDVSIQEIESPDHSSTYYSRRNSMGTGSASSSRNPRGDSSSTYGADEGSTKSSRQETRRVQKVPLSAITLLIHDGRSGVMDHQLTEVMLPTRLVNDSDPEEGFWGDAKLLAEQLQSSAARIDGDSPQPFQQLLPRIFLVFPPQGLRGLSLCAKNIVNFFYVRDLTIEVFVEALVPPGRMPQRPQIPRGYAPSPTPDISSPSPSPERETFYELPEERKRNAHRIARDFEEFRRFQQSLARPDSSSPPLSDGGRKPRQNPGKVERQKTSTEHKPTSPQTMPTGASTAVAASPQFSDSRFESPDLDNSPDDVHRLVSEAMDQLLQDDDEWMEFYQAKAALKPHRAMDVLKQYRFVKRMIDQWAGQQAPFRTFQSHITRALKIEEPENFASVCVETLALLQLYGPKGKHFEDPRVVEMINDRRKPEYNAKPIKRLLHLMQDIDKKWKEEHPDESTS